MCGLSRVFNVLFRKILLQSNEFRIKQLTEDLAAARRALSEKEELVSRLRIEVREISNRVVNIKAL